MQKFQKFKNSKKWKLSKIKNSIIQKSKTLKFSKIQKFKSLKISNPSVNKRLLSDSGSCIFDFLNFWIFESFETLKLWKYNWIIIDKKIQYSIIQKYLYTRSHFGFLKCIVKGIFDFLIFWIFENIRNFDFLNFWIFQSFWNFEFLNSWNSLVFEFLIFWELQIFEFLNCWTFDLDNTYVCQESRERTLNYSLGTIGPRDQGPP